MTWKTTAPTPVSAPPWRASTLQRRAWRWLRFAVLSSETGAVDECVRRAILHGGAAGQLEQVSPAAM